MTTISHPKFTLVPRTVFVDGAISGLREIDSFGSILQVRAAPFSDLDRLMSTACGLTFVTYVIDAAKVYIGRGRGDRKIGDRFDPQELEQAQVYILRSLDERYDQIVGSYVEDRLIDIGHELGVPLANRIRPLGRGGVRISPDLEQVTASSCCRGPTIATKPRADFRPIISRAARLSSNWIFSRNCLASPVVPGCASVSTARARRSRRRSSRVSTSTTTPGRRRRALGPPNSRGRDR